MRVSPVSMLVATALSMFPALTQAQLSGALVYERNCASCHDGTSADSRAPHRDALRQRTPEAIVQALTTGVMSVQASSLSEVQKRQVAEYLSGRPLGAGARAAAAAMPNRCSASPPARMLPAASDWAGWSRSLDNTRYQPVSTRLTARSVTGLKLRWAFGFPGGGSAYGPPTVVGQRVFVGSDNGHVYSLDRGTGCVHWSFEAKGGVRTAVNVAPLEASGGSTDAAFFADVLANVYAVDAGTGRLLWTTRADTHPTARVTGSMALYRNRLYVPVASWEELAGAVPTYECCTFRGSLVALEIATGREAWKSYSIGEPPTAVRRNSLGVRQFRPAGAGIWVTPTIDPERNAVYVATGDAYTSPAPDTSDAILAFDLRTGERLWKYQAIENDSWVLGCNPNTVDKRSENCPDRAQQNTRYHDVDFVGALMLKSLPLNRRLLIGMNQAGFMYALDPDRNGAVVWRYSAEPGVYNFGGSVDDVHVYAPTAFPDPKRQSGDAGRTITGMASGGTGALDAVSIATGQRVWRTPAPEPRCGKVPIRDCSSSQGAASSVIPGVVFSGSRDGVMRAYSTQDGSILWQYETARAFETVNGVQARGGSIDGAGPVVSGDLLLFGSGYSVLGSGMAGNVLLAFGID